MTRCRVPILLLVTLGLGACTARAEGDAGKSYTLAATVTPAAPKKDGPATWALTITPKAPYVLKTSTPLTVSLKPTATVRLDKATLKGADIVDGNSAAKTVRTGFSANAAGDAGISADVTFFLCTDAICQRFKDAVQTRFKVE